MRMMSNNKFNDSRIRRFVSCPRSYYISYVLGFRPQRRSTPLVDGTAIHAGLAALYEGKGYEAAREHMFDAFAQERGPIENYLPQQVAEMGETEEWAERLLYAYFERVYEKEDWTVLGVESEFCVPLGHCCYKCGADYSKWYPQGEVDACLSCGSEVFYWVGRADLIARRNGIVYVIDHKTAKTANANYLGSWANSFQLIGYCYGANRLAELGVGGYAVNVLKKLKSVGTNRERGDVFLREYFPLNAHDVDRFIHNRLTWCLRIREEEKKFENPDTKDEAWAMNDSSCNSYSGCPYKPLDWGNVNPLKWYDFNEETVRALLEERPLDYEVMAREEIR
jgi:hypothetical protein